jgi:hypothetical protein
VNHYIGRMARAAMLPLVVLLSACGSGSQEPGSHSAAVLIQAPPIESSLFVKGIPYVPQEDFTWVYRFAKTNGAIFLLVQHSFCKLDCP